VGTYELAAPHLGIKLYISGGFEDAERSIMLNDGSSLQVPDLESVYSWEEADTRVILHCHVYHQREWSWKSRVHANGTNVDVFA